MGRRARFLTLLFASALAVACGNDTKRLELGAGCTLNSDCAELLQCKFGQCRRACNETRDCEVDFRCVQVDGIGVCRKISELTCATGCRAPLVCGPDQQCRNRCTATQPCMQAQACALAPGAPEGVCADQGDPLLTGGAPPAPPQDAGAPDAPVAPPPPPAVVDAAPEAVNPAHAACSVAGVACCSDKTCGGGLGCTKGARCTCVAACAGSTVLRLDGTILIKGGTLVKGADGLPFKAPGALDLASSWSKEPHEQGGCVVRKNGTVWCWGHNANGRLGAGITDASSDIARQVISAPQLPLTGVRKIATYYSAAATCAADGDGRLWCWGLGARGQLGTGSIADSNVATLARLSPGGPSLNDVLDVSMSYHHTCALKTDGSVYCWGADGSSPRVWANAGVAALACAADFCCVATAPPGNVACRETGQSDAIYVGSMGGGQPLGGVIALVEGRGLTVQALLSNQSLVEWDKTLKHVPAATNGTNVVGPHVLGAGCFVDSEGRNEPLSAVPSCE